MAIAGLDPSITHFGWTLVDESEGGVALLESGTFKTNPKDGLLVQRLIMQRERVRHFIQSRSIRFISMESPYFMDFSTEMLFALNQFIHEVFLDLGVFVLYIPPMRLKKFAVPDVNPQEVTKSHVVNAAKSELDKFGKRFSEHEADAYFAAKIGYRFYQWHILKSLTDDNLTEDEKQLFCGKHTITRGPRKGITDYTGIIYKENDQFFDYSKNGRKTKEIIKEIIDG